MIKRKCGTCRFWKEARLVGNGWCHHPQRRTTSDVMIMVRRNELACRNLWDADLWSPRGGDDDLSTIDGPESFVARRMAPATAEEIAALVNARRQVTAADQMVHEDVLVGEALVMPERSTSVSAADHMGRTGTPDSAPASTGEGLAGIDDSTPLETPGSATARAAIFKARDQFRSRTGSGRPSASPLLPSLPDDFGDELERSADPPANLRQSEERAPFVLDYDPIASEPPVVAPSASLEAVQLRPAAVSGDADRFSSVPDVVPGFELPRARRLTYQPQVAGLGADTNDTFTPSTAVRRAATAVDRSPTPPMETVPWRWQPASVRPATLEPVPAAEANQGAVTDDVARADAEVWSLAGEPEAGTAGYADRSGTADPLRDVMPDDDPVFAEAAREIAEDAEPEWELAPPPRGVRSWLPFASRMRHELSARPIAPYPAVEALTDDADSETIDEPSVWDESQGWDDELETQDDFDSAETNDVLCASVPEVLDEEQAAEPMPAPIVAIEGRAELTDFVIAIDGQLASHLPRICRTCRDFRPAEGGERGWCTNAWAFDHRRMVDLDDQPCETSIGSWWLPADSTWQVAADVSSHGDPTPLLDRWLPDFDVYPVRAVAGERRRRRL